MALEKYNEKRDFQKTKEPKGVAKKSSGKLRFVVQKHAASHLHYDFRLEIDGVLASWAVPKGPSQIPKDKRLAMHVEDHPMDYLDFEGTIPKGEYGGGTVMVWDIGSYSAEGNDDMAKDTKLMKSQLADGSIKIVLDGKKLKGAWHLVQMKRKENHWLLMKAKDEFAEVKNTFDQTSILTGRDFDEIAKGNNEWKSTRNPGEPIENSSRKSEDENLGFNPESLVDAVKLEKFPSGWSPMLATLSDKPFNDDDWLFETKFDGYRAIAFLNNQKINLLSRNDNSFNKKFHRIVEALEIIPHDMILDGEVVMEDEKGKSHFQWLQNYDDQPERGKLIYYVFDILYIFGYDLRALPLIERKKILKAAVKFDDTVKFSQYEIGNGIDAFAAAEKSNGEGIIAKKVDSNYISARSKSWLKIKTGKQQEMVIGGFTEPNGGRQGLGAILCGYYKDDKLIYSGKVGSGFNDRTLKELSSKLSSLERKTSPFENQPNLKNVHWTTPKIVAQIKFSEFTANGTMRHPVFDGVRNDKDAKNVVLENVIGNTEKTLVNDSLEQKKKILVKPDLANSKVEFSNLKKIFWPKEKLTKGDVIDYYSRIAPLLLPYLKDRPQSLRRTPDGILKAGFFQKNVAGMVPKWTKTKKIKSSSKEEPIEYLLCNDIDTLLFMANWGCIELNPWSSRIGSLNNPDYIIFDIDPKDAPWENTITTALKVNEILKLLNIVSYIKTSGGNGLHIFIPIMPKYTYTQSRDFSHIVSQMVHRELPDITSLERMPSKRKGKVYLDFLQNGKGKTMASIYSVRPREGAGVSTPLVWDEVNADLELKDFTISTILQRIDSVGDIWKDFFDNPLDLNDVLAHLNK